jgi:hypothetical protein
MMDPHATERFQYEMGHVIAGLQQAQQSLLEAKAMLPADTEHNSSAWRLVMENCRSALLLACVLCISGVTKNIGCLYEQESRGVETEGEIQ